VISFEQLYFMRDQGSLLQMRPPSMQPERCEVLSIERYVTRISFAVIEIEDRETSACGLSWDVVVGKD
jgi:hypothetical protein